MAAAVLASVAAAAEAIYAGAAARRQERSIRRRLLQATYAAGALSGERGADPARLVTLHTDNCERVTEYRQVYFGSTMAAMAIPFLTLAYVALAIDAILGLAIMALCPLIPLLLAVFMRFFRKTSARSRRQRAVLAGEYLDAIRNLVTIRLFGAGPRIERRLREQGERNRGAVMRLLAGNQVVIIVMDGVFSLLLVCCSAWLTIARHQAGAIDLAQAISVMALTVLLLEPLGQVAGFFYIGMAGRASERAIGAYLASRAAEGPSVGGARLTGDSRPRGLSPSAGSLSLGGASPSDCSLSSADSLSATGPSIPAAASPSTGSLPSAGSLLSAGASPSTGSLPSAVASPWTGASIPASPSLSAGLEGGARAAISVRAVSFDHGRGPVLHGVNLDVPEGAKVAIVGPSGAGKSTLLGLMRGSIPIQEGEITIAGRALSTMRQQEIRELAAPVSQRTWLFTGSIADNLRIARADATEDDMWHALALAQVDEDVARIGLHTDIGEQAARISGGQAQRIALARALLSGRRILLLDEPTAHVDLESEARIIDAIGELGPQWTLVVATHRAAVADSADAVWLLRDGTLAPLEKGAGSLAGLGTAPAGAGTTPAGAGSLELPGSLEEPGAQTEPSSLDGMGDARQCVGDPGQDTRAAEGYES